MAKYIDADKLKAEIERRYNEYIAKKKTDDFIYYSGMADALDLFEQFIDSLEEEPDKSLEKAAEEHLDIVFGKGKHQPFYKELFIAGGKWKEEQMTKEAIDGMVHHSATVHYVSTEEGQLDERLKQFQDGDKVKVIVIKED